jgi:hypothetical protein
VSFYNCHDGNQNQGLQPERRHWLHPGERSSSESCGEGAWEEKICTMSNNLERFKKDLEKLTKLGDDMHIDLTCRSLSSEQKEEFKEVIAKVKGRFENNYQQWYTESYAVIKQLIPDRLNEFTHLYHGEIKRKQIDSTTYNIQDWLNGIRAGKNYTDQKHFDDLAIASNRFNTQLEILKSVQSRFESSLFDIAQLVRADLFDSELDAARELTKNGFLRGAGAIAGVVIERHFAQVCVNHSVLIKKKEPTINDFNDTLKNAGVVDVPGMR